MTTPLRGAGVLKIVVHNLRDGEATEIVSVCSDLIDKFQRSISDRLPNIEFAYSDNERKNSDDTNN